MLFGSAVVVAMLLTGSASKPERSTTHLWLESEPRPTRVEDPRKPPIDLKSVKVMGASGVGAFIPVAPDIGIGVAWTTFRLTPTHRAAQLVLALRFRF